MCTELLCINARPLIIDDATIPYTRETMKIYTIIFIYFESSMHFTQF